MTSSFCLILFSAKKMKEINIKIMPKKAKLTDISANGRLKYLVSLKIAESSFAGIMEVTSIKNPDRPKNKSGFRSTAILIIAYMI